MKVFWTDRAIANLRAVHDYIAQTSPDYAQHTVDRLTRRSEQIGAFPYAGRSVPEFDRDAIREVLEGSYRIIYGIKPSQIDVLAVIHSSRKILLDE
ncbi:MAG: type II toxin-antitoxin system RelE/ParE family toxin [Chloroflexi bacterium]|nr:type II toxin-antitoxin system RelE/ParE family toxin [Chloroflexota bacterium]